MSNLNSRLARWVAGLMGVAMAAALPCFAQVEMFEAQVFTNAAGKTIPYRLLKPQKIETAKSYPLVVFFHGAGERGTDNQKQLVHGVGQYTKAANREKYPCFVFAPQCPDNQQWVDMPWGADSGTRPTTPSAAMELAMSALDRLVKEYNVDANRIYVTGLSMGGYATWDCMTRYPERFAAAGMKRLSLRQWPKSPCGPFTRRMMVLLKFGAPGT